MIKPLIIKPCMTIRTPIADPTVSEPTFPQNIRDGYRSNRKNPNVAPVRAIIEKIETILSNCPFIMDFIIRETRMMTERRMTYH